MTATTEPPAVTDGANVPPGAVTHAAAEQHQTLQRDNHDVTSQRLMCHVDGAECEVLAPIMRALTGICADATQLAQSLKVASDWLSCNRCRAVTDAAERLPGTRLGQRERDILRHAPLPDVKEAEVLCDSADTRACKEAMMRAARKLSRAGLAWTGKKEVIRERRDRKRGKWANFEDGKHWYYKDDLTDRLRIRVVSVCLTPLGAEIRQRYLRELTDSRAIRWDGRVADAAAAARQDIDTLLGALKQEMRQHTVWALGLTAMLSQTPAGKHFQEVGAASDRVHRAITTKAAI